MSVYKETQTNTWRSVYRYTDWTGEKKQTQKRGFATKRDALSWEREQLNKVIVSVAHGFKFCNSGNRNRDFVCGSAFLGKYDEASHTRHQYGKNNEDSKFY